MKCLPYTIRVSLLLQQSLRKIVTWRETKSKTKRTSTNWISTNFTCESWSSLTFTPREGEQISSKMNWSSQRSTVVRHARASSESYLCVRISSAKTWNARASAQKESATVSLTPKTMSWTRTKDTSARNKAWPGIAINLASKATVTKFAIQNARVSTKASSQWIR